MKYLIATLGSTESGYYGFGSEVVASIGEREIIAIDGDNAQWLADMLASGGRVYGEIYSSQEEAVEAVKVQWSGK